MGQPVNERNRPVEEEEEAVSPKMERLPVPEETVEPPAALEPAESFEDEPQKKEQSPDSLAKNEAIAALVKVETLKGASPASVEAESAVSGEGVVEDREPDESDAELQEVGEVSSIVAKGLEDYKGGVSAEEKEEVISQTVKGIIGLEKREDKLAA